ncbi:CaiB/BaiF CoA-transferase family protein [Erythrobacter sp. YT30]|uniref:CaiB/BaiF CoA transferase family protein n=1 Tax=Erythrobacter sp. YT30 TaxID=1735012 RepID=UPI00076CB500|nr:CoA transferase [Erythrobacter sp. YT30]KWV90975.1 CoA-transferase [Erythrobacter sp. YT30]
MSNADKVGALDGLRVVEMGQLLAGPFCGQLLGDMGAEVIKIEPPGAGDPMRNWGQGETKVQWEVIARNKQSVTCNLREPEGQAIARKLIATADVLIENFKPGTLERWGLSPEELHKDNPGLIIARMSGYGQTGPYSTRAGFGGIGEAMGGWRYIVGDPDRPPARMGISIGDTLCASYGCMGVLAALRHRDKTGEGQVIDTALYEAVLQVMEGLVPEYDYNGFIRERSGSILPGIAPSNVYSCKDGPFMIGGNGDAIFARLAKAMGKPAMAEDERYKTHLARGENQTELDEIINEWTAKHTIDEVEALMIEYSIPAGRVFTAKDMLEDPHFKAREAIIEVETEGRGKLKMQNAFPKFSKSFSGFRRSAPVTPGQHNADIYGELLGWDEKALAEHQEKGLV